MSRGRLVPPNLDDRTWQDIVDQARALIPKYAPEWTDHNPSDLGITLIELFAWIVESMIYRLNRVPEKNLIEFLNLLGITRDPAVPASTWLTYRLSGRSAITIPRGNQASTLQTETDDTIIFETDEDLRVLPLTLTTALAIDPNFTRYQNVTTALVGSPLSGTTVSIPAQQSVMLVLGFDASSSEPIALRWRFAKPAAPDTIRVTWRYSSANASPPEWPSDRVEVNDRTEGFQTNGIISLQLPDAWTEQSPLSWSGISGEPPVEQPQFWIGVQIDNITHEGESATPRSIEIDIEHILFNSVSATHALTISQPERLGISNGEPFQAFELQHRPLFKRSNAKDPYDHVILQVREPLVGGGLSDWTTWIRMDDFPQGAGQFFRLDPVTGTIYFGNYHPTVSPDGHGRIPTTGSEIRALTYRYVLGGIRGNVSSNRITILRTPIPGVSSVTNFGAAIGGSDEESIEETQRRGPEALRNRYRAVTSEDYEYLAREASTGIKKVRCLPPREFTPNEPIPEGASIGDPWTYGGLDRSTGTVNVIIIPEAPFNHPRPMPSQELLREVFHYLEERRPVANRLHVTHPHYLPINVTVDLSIWRSALINSLTTPETLEAEVLQKIQRFLHPLWGGTSGQGWNIGQEIAIAQLFETIQPSTEIGFISQLQIAAASPDYQPGARPFPINQPGVWLPIADYEIVCSGTHSVRATPLNN